MNDATDVDDDPLIALIYLLVREHLPFGKLEFLLTQVEANPQGFVFSSPEQLGYARSAAARLRR